MHVWLRMERHGSISGHDTCLVKDGETWWHFSDKAVLPVNMNDINKSLPYVLSIRLHKISFCGF